MLGPYQGNYTFPVASTAERSMQQAANAQAQMFAGLGQEFKGAVDKYFQGKDEKKMSESMAENQIALDVVYGGGDVPADRAERIKDIRGVMRASGGYQNFVKRLENFELREENRAVLAQNTTLKNLQIKSLEDAQRERQEKTEAREDYRKWLYKTERRPEEEIISETFEIPPTETQPGILSERFQPPQVKATGPTRPTTPDVNVVTGLIEYPPEQRVAPAMEPDAEAFARRAFESRALPPRAKDLAMAESIRREERERSYGAADLEALLKFRAEKRAEEKGEREESKEAREARAESTEIAGQNLVRKQTWDQTKSLLNRIKGGMDVTGRIEGSAPIRYLSEVFGDNDVQGQRDLEMFVNNLILDDAAKMKGTLSDNDIKFLKDKLPRMVDSPAVWQEWLELFKVRLENQGSIHGQDLSTSITAPTRTAEDVDRLRQEVDKKRAQFGNR